MKITRLNNTKHGSLLVVGPSRKLGANHYRSWPCRCIRPVHKGDGPIRWVRTGDLNSGKIHCCVECAKEPSKRLDAPVKAERGCAELLCRPPFHSPDCSKIGLFKQSKGSEQKPVDQSSFPGHV
jgi:hypothetical protein